MHTGIPGNPPGITVHAQPPRNTGEKTGETGENVGGTPVFRGGSPEKTRVNPGFSTFYDMRAYTAHTTRICAHIILS